MSQELGKGLQYIKIEELELDPQNPRLPESVNRSPENMINHIALTTSIEDLMSAIAENGFFPGEPLIAVKDSSTGKYTVVEGNRRLTAVKLIMDPHLCERPSQRMLTISHDMTGKLKSLEELPVIVRKDRGEIIPYLGFRHITGVKQWEPLAKARYIEQLFNLTKSTLSPSERYNEVAKAIGSRKDHIKRNLDALAVYKVMEKNNFYNIEGLDEESIKFSILSTALADERIGSYIGVSFKDQDGDSIPNDPIIDAKVINRDKTEELTKWLYEKVDKKKTRVGESRNIRELAAVIDSPKALKHFQSGADLKVAYQLTKDVGKDFLELLFKAESVLIEAAGMVATVEYDKSAHEVARRINKNIVMIGKAIAEKNAKDENEF
ncbi:TPA: ParB N-terminal domain-containing protein [Klebsiella variicola subsp. variicola]|nr:ParB N-terminal domain-containing protein [Klebsiella variicola subsp. variicola]